MIEPLEDLKAMRDGAPKDGRATHIDCDGDYWIMNSRYEPKFHDRDGWNYCETQEPLRSLSDINRIIELLECNK